MPKSLPEKKEYIAVGEAAKLLGVSIDTIRRWDNAGRISSVRLDGKNRYFLTAQLEELKESLPLTISQTSSILGISASTLRRLEKKGALQSTRNSRGERLYDPTQVHEYADSLNKSKKSATKPTSSVQKKNSLVQGSETDKQKQPVETKSPSKTKLDQNADTKTNQTTSSYAPHIYRKENESAEKIEPQITYPSPLDVAMSPEKVNQLHNTPLMHHETSEQNITDDLKNHSEEPASFTYSQNRPVSEKNTHLLTSLRLNSMKRQAMAFGCMLFLFSASIGAYAMLSNKKNVPLDSRGAQQVNASGGSVLAEATQKVKASLNFNIPTIFNEALTVNGLSIFSDDISVQGADLTVDEGNIAVNNGTVTASNLIYSISGGENVTVTGGQNAVISVDIPEVDSVLSLQGQTGALTLTAGSGISISGLTITNSDTGSAQNIFKTVTVDGTSFSAGSNTDTLKFVAGSGITLTPDTSNKQITITSSGVSPGWVDDGTVLRLETATDSVGVGTTNPGAKIESLAAGTPQLRLSYDASNYSSFQVNSSGNLTVSSTGSQVNFSGLQVSASSFSCADCLNFSEIADTLTLDANLTIAPSASNFTINIDSGTLFVDSANNRIGIGTTSPQQALHVAGNIQITGDTNIAGVNYSWPNADGTNGYVLTTDGSGGLTWTDASGIAASINYFELNNGLLSTKYNTADFAIGGSSTSSAKFAVTNVNSGTPRATVSDGTNSIYLDASGSIATTNSMDLTIGSASTGSVKIHGFGVGILHANASGVLTSSALDLAGGANEVTGTLPVANGGTGATTLNDLITLGTHTTGNYVATITNGNGITGASQSEGATLTLGINLSSSLDTSTTSSNSGLEVSANGLSLLRGCDNGYVLKWNDSTKLWECGADIGGLSSAVVNVQEGDVTVSTEADTLDFNANDFALTEDPTGEINIALDYVNSGILRGSQNETVSGSWTFTNAAPFVFEGATADAFETSFAFTDPTADNIITFPNVSGEVSLLGQTIDLTSEVTGTLPIASGGTGATTLNDLITLGTHTTGNFVATITGNTQIGVSGSGSENAAITLSINTDSITDTELAFNTGQHLTTSSSPTFNALSVTSLTAGGDTIDEFVGTGLQLTLGTLSTTLGTSVDLTSEVSGILPIANGGTGASTLNDLITLSTHTTGNYVATITGSGTITSTGATSGEGIAHTLSVTADSIGDTQLAFNTGQHLTTTSSVTFDTLALNNALTTTNGGTGQSTYTAGDMLYYSSGTTLSKLGIGASGYVLTSNGSAPVWSATSSLNYFQRADGAIAPLNITDDFLLGGSATSSALTRFGGTTNANSYFNTGGNVGIGITNPGQKLTVSGGNIEATGTMWNNSFVSTATGATASWRFGACDATGDANCPANGAVIHHDGIATYMAFDSNGNVGIGDVSPSYNLDVTGTGRFTGAATFGSTITVGGDAIDDFTGTGLALSGNALTTTLGTSVDLTAEVTGILPVANGGTGSNTLNDLITLATHTTGNYIATIAGGGQIGVSGSGAENATVTLSINADSIGDTQLEFNTGQHLTTTSSVSFDTLALTNALTTANGGTGQSTYTAGDMLYYSAGTTLSKLAIGGAGYVLTSDGSAPVWSEAASLNYFQRNSQAIAPLNITDDFLLGGNATASALTRFGGTTNSDSFINTGGNLGIGITNPVHKLSVDGTTNITEAATFGSTITVGGDAINDFTGTGLALSSNSLTTTLGTSVDLAAEVNGVLPIANGGTNKALTLAAGGMIWSDGDSFEVSSVGSSGQVLVSGGTGAPVWTSGTISLAQNFAVAGTGSLTLTTGGVTSLTLPATGTLATLAGSEALTNKTVNGLAFTENADGFTIAGGSVSERSFTISDGSITFSTGDYTLTLSGDSALNQNLTTSDSPTFAGLVLTGSSGVLYSSAGTVSSEAQLSETRGGTGIGTYTTGDILYSDGENSLAKLGIGSQNQVLAVSVGGIPEWVSSGNLNFWQRSDGALAPDQITNDLLVGGNATASALFRTPGLTNQNAWFNLGSGNVGIGDTTPTFKLDVTGTGRFTDVLTLDSSIVVGGDTINDFTGTGLVMSGNILTASLGTTVEGSEITNGTIEAVDLEVTASPNDNQILSYDLASGGFTWVDDNDSGGDITAVTAGDGLTGGGTTGDVTLNIGGSSTITVAADSISVTADSIGDTQLAFNTGQHLTTSSGVTFSSLTLGSIALNAAGTNNTNSGASLVGVYDEFANSNGTTVQDVLDDLDAAITGVAHDAVTLAGSYDYLTLAGQVITLNQIDLSTDVTGVLPIANGGTNKALTLDAGGIIWSDADSFEVSGAGTTGQLLVSGGTGSPTWIDASAVGTNYWQRVDGNVSPVNLNDTLAATTSASTLLTLTQTGAFDALLVQDEASDATPFVINSNGNVGIGDATPTYKLDVNGDARITGNLTLDSSIVIGGDTINEFVGTGLVLSSNSLTTTLGTSVDLTTEVTGVLPIANGGTGATTLNDLITLGTHTTGNYVATITGNDQITVGNSGTENAAVTLAIAANSIGNDQLAFDTGQALTTASTPSFTGLTLTSNLALNAQSDVRFYDADSSNYVGFQAPAGISSDFTWTLPNADGSANYALTTNGSGTLGWSQVALGTNWWRESSGTLQPINSTMDFLIGGTASNSAKFAVLNVNNGVPTASVSAGVNGAAYLTAAGTLATTNSQTLTLGGGDTGNIIIDAVNSGTITFQDASIFASNVTIGGEDFTTLTGDGLKLDGTSLALSLTSSGTAGSTQTSSGLEIVSGALTLLKGCADEQVLVWDNTLDVWKCADISGSSGVGDITAVGDVTNGPAFTGTSGNSLYFEGATSDTYETQLTAADPTADHVITLPNLSGTIALLSNPQTFTGLKSFTGGLTLGAASSNTGQLTFANASHAFTTVFQSSTSQGANITYTWPVDDGDSDGLVLKTDGNGVLRWESATGGGGAAGDITAVGSMSSGDAFAGSGADDDCLGLTSDCGSTSAGFIQFDDQAIDEINFRNALVGIGTGSPSTYLTVTNSGLSATGKSIAIFDQYESQDILTASASGTTRLTLSNAGNLSVTGTVNGATISGGTLSAGSVSGGSLTGGTYTASGLTVAGGYTATLGDGNTFAISDGTQTLLSLADQGTTANLTLTGDIAINGGNLTTTASLFEFQLGSGYGATVGSFVFRDGDNNGLLTIDDDGLNAHIHLHDRGVFRFEDTDGDKYIGLRAPSAITGSSIVFSLPDGDGASGALLTTDGSGNLSWTSSSSVNYFQRNSQAIAPLNITDDFLLGGNATASALTRFGGTTNSDSFINTGGNLGIGITNPVHKLSVVGTTNITGAATFGSTVTVGGDAIDDFTGTGLALSGNALTTTLGTSVDLTTEVTGTLSVSSGGTGATTLNDLITLATHTTGNYVATITGNDQISVGNSGTENAAVTLAIAANSIGNDQLAFDTGQALTTTSTPTFNTLSLTSLIISGDTISDFAGTGLQVSGNTLSTTLGTSVDLTSEVNGVLPLANGGTGQSTYTAGDMLYYTSGTTLSKLAIGASGYVLTSNGSAPVWTAASSLNYFQRNDQAISPLNITDDLLVGSAATSSALVRLPGVNNQDAWFNLGTGNLGIGITNPVHKLSVDGTTNVTGATTLESTLTVTGNIDFNGSGTNDIAGTLNLSGNALTSSGALTITPAAGNGLNINLSSTGDFAVNTDQIYADTSTGNVGIGITNPSHKLSVVGTANISDATTLGSTLAVTGNIDFNGTGTNDIAGTLNLSGNALTSSGALTITPAAGNGLNINLSGAGDFAVNTNDLFVDTSTGYVGIGTTSLADILTVTSGASGDYAIYATNTAGGGTAIRGDGTTTGAGIYGVSGDSGYGVYGTNSGTGFGGYFASATGTGGYFTSTSGYALTTGTGNVGIGTTTPIGLLNVNSKVTGKALTILNETGDQAILTASASGTTRFTVANDGSIGVNRAPLSNGGSLAIQTTTSGSPNFMNFYDSNGNAVTTLSRNSSSTQILQLRGANTSEYIEYTSNGVKAESSNDPVSVRAGGTTALTLEGGSGGILFVIDGVSGSGIGQAAVIDTSGNLGIGITNPSHKLSVSGTANVSAATTLGSTLDVTGTTTLAGALAANGNITLGNENTDTLTINAGSSGSGITFGDSSFANCTLTTVSGILTCGAGGGGSLFTDGGDVTYLTSQTDDLALGGTDSTAPFFFDEGGEILTLTNTTGGNSFRVNDEGSDTSPFIIDAGGNVGIGMTNPAQKLNVTGNILASGTLGALNTTPNANYGLNITLADDQRGVNTAGTLTAASDIAYGSYNTISFNNAAATPGILAGTRNDLTMNGNTSQSSAIYGTYNSITLSNTNNAGYGTYTTFSPGASTYQYGAYNQFGTGTQVSAGYGLFNQRVPSTQVITSQYGVYNDFQNLSTMIGLYNELDSTNSNNNIKGVYNDIATTTSSNTFYGVHNDFSMTNAGTVYGTYTQLTSIPGASTVYGVRNSLTLNNSILGGNVYGLHNTMVNGGGAAGSTVYSVYTSLKSTASTGSTYGEYITQDSTSTAGTVYGIYLDLSDTDTTRWGIYETGGATNYFAGTVGIGTTGADAKTDILSTSSQLRLTHTDNTYFAGFTVDGAGKLTLATQTGMELTGGGLTVTDLTCSDCLDFSEFADTMTLDADWAVTTSTNNINFGGGRFFIQGSDGNIGIGTTSPGSFKLNVNGNTNITGALTVTNGVNLSNFTNNDNSVLYAGASGALGVAETTSSNLCLVSQGENAAPIWTTCPTNSSSVWLTDAGNGTLTPINQTMDLLWGASTTASAKFGFVNNNSGTPAMFTTGNLGIGTSAPGYKLDMQGSVTDYLGRFYNSSTNIAAAGLNIRVDGGGNLLNLNYNGTDVFSVTGSQATIGVPTSFTAVGDVSVAYDLVFSNPSVSNIESAAPIVIKAGETFNSSNLTLQTYNKGNVVVTSEAFTVTGSATVSANLSLPGIPTSTNTYLMYVDANGLVNRASSSERYKHNIQPINDDFYKILDATPVTFDYNGTNSHDIGFIAEDMHAKGLGELVIYDGQGRPDAVRYEKIATYLVGVTKDINSRLANVEGNSSTSGIQSTLSDFVLTGSGDAVVSKQSNGNWLTLDNKGDVVDTKSAFTKSTIGELKAGKIEATDIYGVNLAATAGVFENLDASFLTSDSLTINDTLSAGKITTSEISMGDFRMVKSNNKLSLVDQNATESALFSVDLSGNATVSGTLAANRLEAENGEVETLIVKNLIVENISGLTASSSAFFDLGNGISADFAEFDFTTINADLTVLGTTTLREAAITDTLAIGAGELTINSNSINTLSETLEIQSLAQAPVSIMAGAVTIETDGTVTFAENVAFEKDISVKGEIIASVIKGVNDVLNVSGSANFERLGVEASEQQPINLTTVNASGSAGLITLKANQTQIRVNNTKVTEDSLIFITPTGSTQGEQLFIKQQVPGQYFIVEIENAIVNDVKFNFLIVN